MNLRIRTVPLDDDRPLLDLLPRLSVEERFAFVSGGQGEEEGLVGWGVMVDLPLTVEAPFRSGRAALTALAQDASIVDTVGAPGTGLVAFGSFAFAPAAEGSVLRVPRTVVGRRAGRTFRTTIEDATGTAVPEAARASLRPGEDTARHDRPRYAGSTLDDAAWLDAVAEAVTTIRDGHLEKVVLARDLRLWSRTPFDTDGILRGLAARFPSCFTFLNDHLLGASPELLVRREGAAVTSRVLAGTAARGDDPGTDAALGAALLISVKDLREHGLAARSVTDVLRDLCDELEVADAPSLVRLDNVQHLGSDVAGRLRYGTEGHDGSGLPHVLDLLAALHPTAAVAGTPRGAALDLIARLEGMDRERYAGPVGWCTSDGDGEFAIALRCAEIRGTRARLFAGAGVVADSVPGAELTETWLKLRAMTGVLDSDSISDTASDSTDADGTLTRR